VPQPTKLLSDTQKYLNKESNAYILAHILPAMHHQQSTNANLKTQQTSIVQYAHGLPEKGHSFLLQDF